MNVDILKKNFFVLLLPMLCMVSSAVSQEAPPEVPVASVLDKLSEPNAQYSNGVVINSYNSSTYQSLFIPELLTPLRSGALHVTAFNRLQFEPVIGASFKEEAISPSLDDTGALAIAIDAVSGPLYSQAENSEVSGQTAVQRILWNAHSIWWSARYLDSDFSLHFVRNDNIFRTYKGRYRRVYPKSIRAEDKTEQLFRSRLDFFTPDVIAGFSWLRFRFQRADNDVLFMYSPVTKKTRQLTASNVTDPLLGSSLTLNDLLLWSGKVNELEGGIESVKTYLVPFVPIDRVASFGRSDSCERYTLENPRVLWNYHSRKYAPGASWLPTAAMYVPRVLQRIALSPKDPYSVYGRQVLYVDAATGLPVYKIVFDTAGAVWKTVIAVYGVDSNPERSRAFSLLQQIVLDLKRDQATLLQFDKVRTCTKVDAAAVLREFSPAALVPVAPEVPQVVNAANAE